MAKEQKGYKKIGTKNGLGVYETYIIVGYDALTGKPNRVHRKFNGTSEDAKLWYADLVKKYYHKGEKVNLTKLTFEEYSKIFIERYCVPNIGVVTIKDYKGLLKDIIPLIGDLQLNKITTLQLDTMYQKLKIGKDGTERSPKTLIHYYDLVGLMFKQAKKWKLIEINQHLDTTRPKVPKKKKKIYDLNDIISLLNCLESENITYRTMITLGLVSGMRAGELCALMWSDIDFNESTIYIDNSLKVVEGVVNEKNAKTDYSIRTIDIDPSTMELLKEYKKWQNDYSISIGDKWVDTGRVFTDIHGNHTHPSTCNDRLQKVLKRHNLSHITFHELRHICSTILCGMGVDPVTIQERMGHANPDFTLDKYTHPLLNNKKKSADVFLELKNASNLA